MNLSFTSDSSLTRLIDEDVYLEESLQVCAIEFIEVDMKTTVTTMMKSDTRGGGGFRQPDPILVRVDRSFGIVIMYKSHKLIHFSGIIKTPEVIENEKA